MNITIPLTNDSISNGTCSNINVVMGASGDWTTLPLVQFFIFLFYFLIFITAIVGNCCVIFSVSKHKTLQTVRNVFIVGLSCSDMAAAFMSVLITPVMGVVKEWHFGLPMCHLIPLCQGTALCFSTFTMACISIDRWILIKHPTNHSLKIDKKQATVMLGISACLAVAVAAPPAYFFEITSWPGICGGFCMENWPDDAARKAYGLTLTFITFFLPLVVVAFCYTSLGVALNARTEAKVQQGIATAHLTSHSELTVPAHSVAPQKRTKSEVRKPVNMEYLLPTTYDRGRSYSESGLEAPLNSDTTTFVNNNPPKSTLDTTSQLADIMEEDTGSLRDSRANSFGTRSRTGSHGQRSGGKFRLFRGSLSAGMSDSNFKFGSAEQAVAYTQREISLLKRQKRTNRMLISMVLIFASCWFLFVLMNFLRDIECMPQFVRDQEGFFQLLVHCIAVSSTGWNPLLYAFMNEQFRAAFKQIFGMAPCCRKLVSRPRNYILSRRMTTMSIFQSRPTTRLGVSSSDVKILDPSTAHKNGKRKLQGVQALVELTTQVGIPEIED